MFWPQKKVCCCKRAIKTTTGKQSPLIQCSEYLHNPNSVSNAAWSTKCPNSVRVHLGLDPFLYFKVTKYSVPLVKTSKAGVLHIWYTVYVEILAIVQFSVLS